MTAANGADILASKLPRRARVHDLHIRVVQPRHHFPGGDRHRRIDLELERNGRKPRCLAADRSPRGGPVLDPFMIDADIAAAEILHGVEPEIGIPATAATIDDDFALWVEARGPEYLFDAVDRNEILCVVVTQNLGRIANADGASNVSSGVDVCGSHVPNKGVSCDRVGNILGIDNGGRGHSNFCPKERKRNDQQTFHDQFSVSSGYAADVQTKSISTTGGQDRQMGQMGSGSSPPREHPSPKGAAQSRAD